MTSFFDGRNNKLGIPLDIDIQKLLTQRDGM